MPNSTQCLYWVLLAYGVKVGCQVTHLDGSPLPTYYAKNPVLVIVFSRFSDNGVVVSLESCPIGHLYESRGCEDFKVHIYISHSLRYRSIYVHDLTNPMPCRGSPTVESFSKYTRWHLIYSYPILIEWVCMVGQHILDLDSLPIYLP